MHWLHHIPNELLDTLRIYPVFGKVKTCRNTVRSESLEYFRTQHPRKTEKVSKIVLAADHFDIGSPDRFNFI